MKKKNITSLIKINLAFLRRGEWLTKKLLVTFTPKWFEILGWLFLIAALQYAFNKSNSKWIGLLLFISLASLFFFIYYSFDLYLERVRRKYGGFIGFFTLLISILTSILLFFFARKILEVFEIIIEQLA